MSGFDLTKLEQFDGDWDKAKVKAHKTGDFEKLPAGEYVAKVEKAYWKDSKAGLPMLSLGLIVQDGEFKGRYIWKNSVIRNAQSLQFLKSDLHAMGLKMEKISTFDPVIMLDLVLDLKLVHKGDFENVYVNGVHKVDPLADIPEANIF